MGAAPRDDAVSRRALLKGAAALTVAEPMLLVASPAPGQQKTPKEAAQYQNEPNGDEQCSKCRFFIEPRQGEVGHCKVVRGEIEPGGWCRLYTPPP